MTAAEPADAEEFAPAKINLALHVTGRRADGYHLLDSLVVFASVGDRVRLRRGAGLRLEVTGPMAAGVPADDRNLVLRAARLAGATGAAIVLDKHLPAASGIGGGSSDAAATLRALDRAFGLRAANPAELGADLPVCMLARPARMRGVGEILTPLAGLPDLPAVLVNPGVALATGDVFRGLAGAEGAQLPVIPTFPDAPACVDWLRGCRNDLEAPARARQPVIGDCLQALAGAGALLARMSGSGATCFGLFAAPEAARLAAAAIGARHPAWWVRETTLAGSAG